MCLIIKTTSRSLLYICLVVCIHWILRDDQLSARPVIGFDILLTRISVVSFGEWAETSKCLSLKKLINYNNGNSFSFDCLSTDDNFAF